MADKTIGSLPAAPDLYDDSLLAVEQQGQAVKLTGAQIKGFARQGVSQYVQAAQDAASEALEAVGKVGDSVEQAQTAAQTAQEYSGKPRSSRTEPGGPGTRRPRHIRIPASPPRAPKGNRAFRASRARRASRGLSALRASRGRTVPPLRLRGGLTPWRSWSPLTPPGRPETPTPWVPRRTTPCTSGVRMPRRGRMWGASRARKAQRANRARWGPRVRQAPQRQRTPPPRPPKLPPSRPPLPPPPNRTSSPARQDRWWGLMQRGRRWRNPAWAAPWPGRLWSRCRERR